MFDIDRWREIGHVLSKNKMRTILTGLGVFTGIFILIVLLGGATALENGVIGQFKSTTSNSVVFGGSTTTLPYGGYQPGRKVQLEFEDAALLESRIQGIDRAYPRRGGAYYGRTNISRNGISEAFPIQGELPDIYGVEPVFTIKGRFINPNDIEKKKKVAVIGKRVKEVLFQEDEEAVGEYIKIGGAYYMVVGVFDSDGKARRGQEPTEIIYIPTSTYQVQYNMGNQISYMFVNFTDEKDSEEGMAEIKALLKEKYDVHPDDQRGFWGWDIGAFFRKTSALFTGVRILMWIVGMGSFLAGVIGVTNIMLVVIKERTQEFGVMRAIGAKPITIQGQVIMESVVLTSIAGFVGFVTGVLVVYSGQLEKFFVQEGSQFNMFQNPSVDFNTAMMAIVCIIIFGAIAGWVPAKRAIQIRPVEALQTE